VIQPPGLKEEIYNRVMTLIERVNTNCVTPIFLFTRESDEDIEETIKPMLKSKGLYFDDPLKNFIFIENKKNIKDVDYLFNILKNWIENTATIYIFKLWFSSFIESYNKTYKKLFVSSNSWPSILWDNFNEENENPSNCINELIFQLIKGNNNLLLDEKIILKNSKKIDMDEIKIIWKGLMYQTDNLTEIKPGDIYFINKNYYINIRPECDTVQGRDYSDYIILIRIKKLSKKDLERRKNENGDPHPIITEAFLYLFNDHNLWSINFKNIIIRKTKYIKKYRIARVLPPFINEVQQRFSSFIGRFGIPSIPKDLRKEIFHQ